MRSVVQFVVGVGSGLALLACFSTDALAQSPSPIPASSLADLSILVGERVEVARTDGSTVTGILAGASDTSLRLDVTAGRTIDLPVVTLKEISRREKDSLGNGLGFGFLLGAVIGAGAGAVVGEDSDESVAGMTGFYGALIGLAAGGIIDASRHRRVVVYRAPAPVAFTPILGRSRVGLAAHIRF